jgi:hypothetical protein
MATNRSASGFLAWLPAQPELFVLLFAFLLNFVWEMWQVPFFRDIGDAPHWRGVIVCTQATFGDAAIALFAFTAVALFSRRRLWLLAPSRGQIAAFLAIGLALTVVFEALATGPLARWRYGDAMPTLPWLGTGALPLLQWLTLPPLVLWLARRQILGARVASA